MPTEQKWAEAFASAFMQPSIHEGTYFQVNTSAGTEIIPTDVIGHAQAVEASALLDHLEGKPDDPEEVIEVREGWLARLSAPGYLDCTDWTAHATEDAAKDYLIETYGDDE